MITDLSLEQTLLINIRSQHIFDNEKQVCLIGVIQNFEFPKGIFNIDAIGKAFHLEVVQMLLEAIALNFCSAACGMSFLLSRSSPL